MRLIKCKDKNGLIHKMEGLLCTDVKDTETGEEIYEGDIVEIAYRDTRFISKVFYDCGTLSVEGENKMWREPIGNYIDNENATIRILEESK